jgi:serine protease
MEARIKARARTLEAVKRLRASGRYQWVEPNWIRRPLVTPSDEYFESQWNLHAVHMPQAWDLSRGDGDVIVAVLDTGILPNHPDLGTPDDVDGRLIAGHDFVSDADRAGDGDGRDPDPTDPGSGEQLMASGFHGTHVAGIIAARTDNGTGVAGSGWNTRVMPLRVLGLDGGTSADLIEALRYAGGLPNASGLVPERAADVINLSLGSAAYSQAEQDVITELRSRGIIVISAAGNDASDGASYPAAYDGVVSVAATTITDDIAYYSNRGATVDIAAPGGDTSTDINGDGIADGILSTLGDDSDGDPSTAPVPNLGVMSGTSMAAPHVAGVAALMKTVYPDMTPETFDALLAGGQLTSDRGSAGRDDHYGHGLLDAQRAVLAALDAAGRSGEVPGVLVATPTTLNFGPFTDRLEFRLSNAGNLPLSAGEPAIDASWMRLEPVSVDADGLGTWALIVDREQLPEDGVYRGGVRIDSDANTISLAAHVERASIDLSADAGLVHVLLTPEDDDEALYRTTGRVRAGAYDFDLEGVAPGRYRLIAGTDADGDGLICDAGEACGAWRTIDAPVILEVSESDRHGLEFVIAFRMSISTNDPVTSRP